MVDKGPFLDTARLHRSEGPIIIQLPEKRYMGRIDSEHHLVEANAMIAKHTLSEYALLELVIDNAGNSEAPTPAHHRLWFNGHNLGFISGYTNKWKVARYHIPMDWIKFPEQGNSTSAPTPENNEIKIDIDVEADEDELHAIAVDWVALDFDAMAPIVFIHGINTSSGMWDGDINYLYDNNIVYNASIDLAANGARAFNGSTLSKELPKAARSLGATQIHLVCFSKGGLDARDCLSRFYSQKALRVLSISTLSTPHKGSIIANIMAPLTIPYLQHDRSPGIVGQRAALEDLEFEVLRVAVATGLAA